MSYPDKEVYCPSLCCTHDEICAFAVPKSEWEEVSNDPNEAYFDCNLLGEEVRGEDPPCHLRRNQSTALSGAIVKCIELTKANDQLKAEHLKKDERIERLAAQANAQLSANIRSSEQISAMRTDFITTLRALELLLSSSINTEHNHLTHRARNFRTRHQVEIIKNQLKILQVKPSNYADDF